MVIGFFMLIELVLSNCQNSFEGRKQIVFSKKEGKK